MKTCPSREGGSGLFEIGYFTSLPPICELLATCVMKSTFNHKKGLTKIGTVFQNSPIQFYISQPQGCVFHVYTSNSYKYGKII